MQKDKTTDAKNETAIWVDTDACPVAIKDVIIRAAKRTETQCTFVANQALQIPSYPTIRFIQVEKGYDIADNLIANRVAKGDLVVTQDIPLADEVITAGATAIGPRGQLYTRENIKARLGMRDFMETMRSSGIQSGGPAAMSKRDVQEFANQIDRWLARRPT